MGLELIFLKMSTWVLYEPGAYLQPGCRTWHPGSPVPAQIETEIEIEIETETEIELKGRVIHP